ncbi:alpha/beta hydrolase [Maribacter sp. 2307ULW6-5]|uniref:alpha/beta hydrolase n=1 Tax=Maribacter sp. 2307ULW6-5 TaxID=3386275 RepID=UPI0039BD873F
MKKAAILLFLFCALPFGLMAQEVTLSKGAITEGLVVNDSLKETFSVFLPKAFDTERAWPIVFVMDLKGKGRQALSMFTAAAEQEGFVLVAPDHLSDSLSLSQNVLVTNRLFNRVATLLPIEKSGVYTAGFDDGARFASVLPTFINRIKGVIAVNASMATTEVLNPKNPFHFVGVVSPESYNYTNLLNEKAVMKGMKMPHHLVLHKEDGMLPDPKTLGQALKIAALQQKKRGAAGRDEAYVRRAYEEMLDRANMFFTNNEPLLAENVLENMEDLFKGFKDTDALRSTYRTLRRSKSYRIQMRRQESYMLNESFTREDYSYYLEEDIMTYNFKNLGWWQFQMEELDKLEKAPEVQKKRLARRLRGYVNALIDDNMELLASEKELDTDALLFTYMLKTITEPQNPEFYLKVISNSSRVEDYGTALFYLEELLKKGYREKERIYALENAALFRVTPEFNELMDTYFKDGGP